MSSSKFTSPFLAKSPLNQVEPSPLIDPPKIIEPVVDIGTALYKRPGYEPVEMITGREKAKKVRGKLGRKQRKLGRIEDDIADIGNRILFEKTPDTISDKMDRKLTKYRKTKRQIKEIKNNK